MQTACDDCCVYLATEELGFLSCAVQVRPLMPLSEHYTGVLTPTRAMNYENFQGCQTAKWNKSISMFLKNTLTVSHHTTCS